MAINVGDPNLKLLYGLDESMATAVRVNSGSLGSTHDLTPSQASGTDGIPAVADGSGGKALDLFTTRTGWTTSERRVSGTAYAGTAHPLVVPLPISSAADDFAFGCRIYYAGLNTGGGANERETIFGLIDTVASSRGWLLSLLPDDATAPTAGMLTLSLPNSANNDITGASYTITNAPPTFYILKNEWYRIVVRVFYNGAGYRWKVYLLRESTGVVYTFLYIFGSDVTSNWSIAGTALRLSISTHSNTSSNPHSFGGYIDDCWFYDGGVTDAEATSTLLSGISIPWTPPSYTFKAHDTRVAWTNEASSSFPVPRALPNGTLYARHPASAWGSRMRLWLESVRASRPFSLRLVEAQFDVAGPKSSAKAASFPYGAINEGLIRMAGALPPGCVIDTRNVEFSEYGPRRRQGFKVRRDTGTTQRNVICRSKSWRTNDDQLHRLYKVGTELYAEAGASATLLESSWPATQLPSFGILDNRLIILTTTRQRLHRGSILATDPFGQAAPTAGSVAAGAGTLVGTYAYAYTWYDPNTGDETAPKEVGSVTLSTQGGALSSLSTSPADTRFTQQRIYRTTAGGASPNYFLIATQNNASTYTDGSGADGTISIGKADDEFITSVPPDTFGAVAIHAERAFFYQGQTYPARIYWGEANEAMRFWSRSFVTCEGPVRAVIGQGSRIVAVTDRTVEIIESDWARDTDGNYQVRRTVVSRNVGGMGHACIMEAAGRTIWIDRRGIYELVGDKVVKISQRIDNLFPYLNTGLGYVFCSDYNHRRNEAWFTVSMASPIQDDSTVLNTQIVYRLDTGKWTLYDMNLSGVGQFDDDQNGMLFGGSDQSGTFKELCSYEGDGLNDSDNLALSEGTISSISTNRLTITPVGTPGWTASALRGMGVVFRDVSTGLIYYYTIIDNATGTFTLERALAAALAATDEYYIAGIRGYLETSEQNFGTTNKKVQRFLYWEFDRLTAGRLV